MATMIPPIKESESLTHRLFRDMQGNSANTQIGNNAMKKPEKRKRREKNVPTSP
jgi:hypothetical protein